jgi:hypothetical protein
MSILALPEELLDHIVGLLRSELPSLHTGYAPLRACAAAHSRLRSLSQRHLFHELELTCERSAACAGAVLRASPVLAAAVRIIALYGAAPDMLLATLDATLPKLHTLQLEGYTSTGFDATEARAPRVLSGFESTRRLIISSTDFADTGHVMALLYSLPRVAAVQFAHCPRVFAPAALTLAPLTPVFALVHLDLRGFNSDQNRILDELARWLCARGSPAVARLETLWARAYLELPGLPSTLQVVPQLLLTTVAPTLKRLCVQRVFSHSGA